MRFRLIIASVALLLPCQARAGGELAVLTNAPSVIELRDQFDSPQTLSFPSARIVVLTISDRIGSEQVDDWIAALKPLYATRVDFRGLAKVAGIPRLFQPILRRKFQEKFKYPIMMDWSGAVCARFGYQSEVANLLVIAPDGRIRARFSGRVTPAALASARSELEAALAAAHANSAAQAPPGP